MTTSLRMDYRLQDAQDTFYLFYFNQITQILLTRLILNAFHQISHGLTAESGVTNIKVYSVPSGTPMN